MKIKNIKRSYGVAVVIMFALVVVLLLPASNILDSVNQIVLQSGLGSDKSSPSLRNVKVSSFPYLKHINETNFKVKENRYTKVVFESNLDQKVSSSLLITSTVSSSNSYGKNRSFKDLFEVIDSIKYSKKEISLSFSFKEEEEFIKLYKFFDEYYSGNHSVQYSVVTLLISPFIEMQSSLNRADRHGNSVQRSRRRTIAKSRNFILNHSLRDETYTLSFDCDITKVNENIANWFIASGKDIIVPRIASPHTNDYDRNSWVGERAKPSAEEFSKLDKSVKKEGDFIYVPHDKAIKHLVNLIDKEIEENSNEASKYLVELDSVGGAVLFIKSEILQQGAQFPPFYIIGSEWSRFEGYDGIETEGLCYLLRTIGYSCWAMPMVVARHA